MAASYQTEETTELILTFPECYADAMSLINDDYLSLDVYSDAAVSWMLNEEDMRAYGQYHAFI